MKTPKTCQNCQTKYTIEWDEDKFDLQPLTCPFCGYEVDDQRTDGTYGRYTGIDDKFEWLHFYCQYIKFGIGRCRFDVSQEIRNNHIDRKSLNYNLIGGSINCCFRESSTIILLLLRLDFI